MAAVRRPRYVEAVGRRKTAVVRVRMWKADAGVPAGVTVNGRKLASYFPLLRQRLTVTAPLSALGADEKQYAVSALARGGGLSAQAEALCLGIARALITFDATSRSRLKSLGYLKRDPRMVERKKFGSRKARRPQQWRKR
ncbi:MAG: 30S ribosomal protein S9 [Patescibacteria group bacterium]